jgi:hypothetical protein
MDVSARQVDRLDDAVSVAESIMRAFADIERGLGARTGHVTIWRRRSVRNLREPSIIHENYCVTHW